MSSKNLQDGFLCDRCGEPATHFHEDFGNVCPACAIHWSAVSQHGECDDTRAINPIVGGPIAGVNRGGPCADLDANR